VADAGMVYVYGVLAASDCAELKAPGVEGSRVRCVEREGLAALVSDLQGDSITVAREVRAHWNVLDAVSQKATVLPVRFGTVMEGEHAVREQMLEANAERIEALLGELRGRVQLTIKGEYDEERVLREVVNESPAVAGMRERLRSVPEAASYYGRIRLGELVAGEIAARREHDSARALERLEPLSVRVHAEQPRSAEAAFNLAFLVERDGIERFSSAVAGLGEELGDRVRIRYLGPLPPYSFAEGELTAGGP
jgi:phage gp37-like protein